MVIQGLLARLARLQQHQSLLASWPATWAMADEHLIKRLASTGGQASTEQTPQETAGTSVRPQRDTQRFNTTRPYQRPALRPQLAGSQSGQQTLLVTSQNTYGLRFCSRADVARFIGCSPQDVRVKYGSYFNDVSSRPVGFYVVFPDAAARDRALDKAQAGSLKLGAADVDVVAASMEEVSSGQGRIARWQRKVQDSQPAQYSTANMAVVTSTQPVTKKQLLAAFASYDLVPPYVASLRPPRKESDPSEPIPPDDPCQSHLLFFDSEVTAMRAACDGQPIVALGPARIHVQPLQ